MNRKTEVLDRNSGWLCRKPWSLSTNIPTFITAGNSE